MKRLSLLILLFFFFSIPVKAAGILAVCNDGGDPSNCSKNSIQFPTYEISGNKAVVEYRIDPGSLGDFSSATLESSVSEILNTWEDVSSLDFQAEGNGFIAFDVNSSNYESILFPSSPLGYSPIIFDDTGTILTDILGSGAKQDILGFAAARFFTTRNGTIENIFESQSLINGFLFTLSNRPDFSSQDDMLANFKTTILHEFAHMVGLDHSQGGQIEDFLDLGASLSELQKSTIPVMFPIAINPTLQLQRDDIASVNIGYPKNSVVSGTASISGSVINGNDGVRTANVIAYNIDDPLGELVSSVTDVDGKDQGNFVIPNLSPGTYVIKVEPIAADFVGGSIVGIHEPDFDTSLIPSAFYNGSEDLLLDLNLDQGLSQGFPIVLTAGQALENLTINIGEDPKSFSLRGRAVNNLNFLNVGRKSRANLRIVKEGTGIRLVTLSSPNPELISFSKNPVRVGNRRKARRVRVRFRPFNEFITAFPELNNSTVEIPITATDIVTGDTVTTNIEIF